MPNYLVRCPWTVTGPDDETPGARIADFPVEGLWSEVVTKHPDDTVDLWVKCPTQTMIDYSNAHPRRSFERITGTATPGKRQARATHERFMVRLRDAATRLR